MRKLVVFPNDPILAYYKKGEIKARYFNPGNFFDEIHVISLCDEEVQEEKVREIAGNARLVLYPVGQALSFIKPCLFFKKRNQILRLVKEINPSVIRAYNPVLNGALAIYCGKSLNIPTVVSLHGNYDLDIRYHLKRRGKYKELLISYIYSKLFGYEFCFIVIDKNTLQIGIFDCSPDFYRTGADKVQQASATYDLFYKDDNFDPSQYFISKTL